MIKFFYLMLSYFGAAWVANSMDFSAYGGKAKNLIHIFPVMNLCLEILIKCLLSDRTFENNLLIIWFLRKVYSIGYYDSGKLSSLR